MAYKKATMIMLLVVCTILIVGSISAANSINDRLVTDFTEAMQHAAVYRELVLSETGEPVELVLTVYEEPVVIDYFYNSMDEVDFSLPEGVSLSNSSAFTLEWSDATWDIQTPPHLEEWSAEGLLRFKLWYESRLAEYVVGKIELTYDQTDYVMFKIFREFESYGIYFVNILAKTGDRWKLVTPGYNTLIGYLGGLFTNLKVPVFAAMLTRSYRTPVIEVQQFYHESIKSGVFEHILP